MFDGEDETKTERRGAKGQAGPGRRRWSAEDKARIVAEAMAPGAVVAAVARRWQVRPQQVFAWRREAGCGDLEPPSAVAMAGSSAPEFVPILTEAAGPADPTPVAVSSPAIEVELAGAVVRVMADTDMDTALLTAVLRAVRASAST